MREGCDQKMAPCAVVRMDQATGKILARGSIPTATLVGADEGGYVIDESTSSGSQLAYYLAP